jgi:ABC-type branched-subunit amino acid transport system substrate-binding protein
LKRILKNPAAAASVVLAAALALAACGGGSQRAGGRKALRLTIGDIVPLSGQQEPLGLPGKKAADLAVQEIKRAIVAAKADHRITIRHENDRSDQQAALELATGLVRSGASCITGPWSTGSLVQTAAAVTIPKKVLEISPAASSDALVRLQDAGYVNRTVTPDSLQGPALAHVMDTELHGAKGKTVNIAAFRNIYGKTSAASFAAAWKKLGGEVGATVAYESSLPSYDKQVRELTSGKPDAWVFFDFLDTYIKVAPALLRTHHWKPSRTFVGDALAVATLPSSAGRDVTEGVRGVAPGVPDTTPLGRAFDKLYRAAPGPRYRQNFDAQNFDAVVLCYLSAVAAGSTKGKDMADFVQKVSAPPGEKYTWLQLPQAIRALQNGDDIDYQGASGPIDMNAKGNPTAGTYYVFRFRKSLLELYGETNLPGQGIIKIKPRPQNPFPAQKQPTGTTGATGATGASGPSGATGPSSKNKSKKRQRKR